MKRIVVGIVVLMVSGVFAAQPVITALRHNEARVELDATNLTVGVAYELIRTDDLINGSNRVVLAKTVSSGRDTFVDFLSPFPTHAYYWLNIPWVGFQPRGIGGGGAMSSFSMSPYSDTWFVGTDMGTLFRSINRGAFWKPISHYQARYSASLPYSAYLGFCSDSNIVFYASEGRNPQRTADGGVTWPFIPSLGDQLYTHESDRKLHERIKYWNNDHFNENIIFAGTTRSLFRSADKGLTWSKVPGISGNAQGTVFDYVSGGSNIIYHATSDAIYRSTDNGVSFTSFYSPEGALKIRGFTGGRDLNAFVLAFIDDDINAAIMAPVTITNNCGYVWVKKDDESFIRTSQLAGDHIVMAENDSSTIYVTGSQTWHGAQSFGTTVWRSDDAGQSWKRIFRQLEEWSIMWPADRLEYSAVGLDVGYWDSGYYSFAVNKRNSSELGGTGNFFLHISTDKGEHWKSPFTKYVDTGPRGKRKFWESVGLEVTTVYTLKFHPSNPSLAYAGYADICGLFSQDGGKTFRFSIVERWANMGFNSMYDITFDPAEENVAYAAVGGLHDFPSGWYGNLLKGIGGIFKTEDRGLTWERFTPNNDDFSRQFLSVAFDPIHDTLYAGSQSIGVAKCDFDEQNQGTWEYINDGLNTNGIIVPKIQIDPENGNAYILVTGNRPLYTNREETGVYFLDREHGSTTWELLRGNVEHPEGVNTNYLMWWYPTSFAVDFSSPLVPGERYRSVIWLTDLSTKGAWMASGAWKTIDGGGTNWLRQIYLNHSKDIKIQIM